jgi:hypothetical protein
VLIFQPLSLIRRTFVAFTSNHLLTTWIKKTKKKKKKKRRKNKCL